jgi:hypothetical protein
MIIKQYKEGTRAIGGHGFQVRPYQFNVLFPGQIGAGNRPGWSA